MHYQKYFTKMVFHTTLYLYSPEDMMQFLKHINTLLLNSLSEDTSVAAFENALHNFNTICEQKGLDSAREVLSGLANECDSSKRENSCKALIRTNIDFAGYSYDGMKSVLCRDYQIFLSLAYTSMYKHLFVKNDLSIMNQLQSDILSQIWIKFMLNSSK